MQTRPNERTLRMMESYVDLHNAGHTVAEVAKMFNLSESTVYARLGEIAKKAGTTREKLLFSPFEADHSGRNFTPVKPIDPTKFHAHFDVLMGEIGSLKQEVKNSLDELELVEEILQEEIKK